MDYLNQEEVIIGDDVYNLFIAANITKDCSD